MGGDQNKSGWWKALKRSFDPHNSHIWAKRASISDGKQLFDTPEIEYQRFAADWMATVGGGITKVVLRHDDDPAEDEDGDGIPDEVQEVGEVLWHHHRTLCVLFSFYAAIDQELHCASSRSISPFETISHRLKSTHVARSDPASMLADLHLNAWTQFAKDFHLTSNSSKFCKQSDIDRLFIAVDSASKHQEKEALREAAKRGDRPNRAILEDKSNALSRNEFLTALVHLAINKYVQTKMESDVSQALERLIGVDITSQLTPAFAHPDSFRRAYLYSKPVAQVFEFHEASLRRMFNAIAMSGGGKTQTVDMKEWLASLRALDLIGTDITEREGVLCFVWSRLAVTETMSLRGMIKDSTLHFEGWLEALARLACHKALPTCKEIRDLGCMTTGQYFDRMHETDEAALLTMLAERTTEWGDVPSNQPFFHTLSHMLELIIHRIERMLGATDGGDMQITEAEMARFLKQYTVDSAH